MFVPRGTWSLARPRPTSLVVISSVGAPVVVTPLIGVQKALGAKRSFVLAQFLTEAVALCIIGAMMALLAVELLVLAVNATSEGFSLVFGLNRFLLGLGIAVVSGIVAGLAPAMQAARMDPVEAMRAA